MWETVNGILETIDGWVWGVPLIVLILAGGVFVTARLGFLQLRRLPLALKWMVKNEENGEGEVTSFGALCTALSATIGTGNIVGVGYCHCSRRPGSSVLDGGGSLLRYGHQICGRPSGSKVSCG